MKNTGSLRKCHPPRPRRCRARRSETRTPQTTRPKPEPLRAPDCLRPNGTHGPVLPAVGLSGKPERYSEKLKHSGALVLFDIDGTLIRRAGPHHREALVEAIRRTAHVETTTEGVPVAGMLDRDILTTMMLRAGMPRSRDPPSAAGSDQTRAIHLRPPRAGPCRKSLPRRARPAGPFVPRAAW